MKPPTDTTGALPAEMAVAETVGRLMHFWGFKRPMGRLWTVLYLSPEPLSAAQLSETLTMSAGAVSMALAELEKWGAVTRIWKAGDRRDYFAAEPSIWKMVQRVVRERELGIVKDFGSSLKQAQAELSAHQDSGAEDQSASLRYKLERLQRLAQLSQAGETILSALVSGDAVDPVSLLREPETRSGASLQPQTSKIS